MLLYNLLGYLLAVKPEEVDAKKKTIGKSYPKGLTKYCVLDQIGKVSDKGGSRLKYIKDEPNMKKSHKMLLSGSVMAVVGSNINPKENSISVRVELPNYFIITGLHCWGVQGLISSIVVEHKHMTYTGVGTSVDGLHTQDVHAVHANSIGLKHMYMKSFRKSIGVKLKEEADFIEGEVVEIQIDHSLEFARILHIPCEGVCMFSPEWSIASLSNCADPNPTYLTPLDDPVVVRDAIFNERPPKK
ncbi:ribonuclease H-like domain-containing protein [Tanacetum coccineum]